MEVEILMNRLGILQFIFMYHGYGDGGSERAGSTLFFKISECFESYLRNFALQHKIYSETFWNQVDYRYTPTHWKWLILKITQNLATRIYQ